MNHLNLITKLTLLLVVLLGVANLVATNVLATGGAELQTLSQETIEIQKDNLNLKNKIAEKTSLASIETRSQNLGFEPISHTLVIATPAPVAYVAQ